MVPCQGSRPLQRTWPAHAGRGCGCGYAACTTHNGAAVWDGKRTQVKAIMGNLHLTQPSKQAMATCGNPHRSRDRLRRSRLRLLLYERRRRSRLRERLRPR